MRGLPTESIAEVRGRGLLIGVKMTIPARPVAEALKVRGVLVEDTHGTILRFTSPLTIQQAEVNFAVEALAAVLFPLKP